MNFILVSTNPDMLTEISKTMKTIKDIKVKVFFNLTCL